MPKHRDPPYPQNEAALEEPRAAFGLALWYIFLDPEYLAAINNGFFSILLCPRATVERGSGWDNDQVVIVDIQQTAGYGVAI